MQGRAKVGRRPGAKVGGPLLFGCRLAESATVVGLGWTGFSRLEMMSRASPEKQKWEAPGRGAGVRGPLNRRNNLGFEWPTLRCRSVRACAAECAVMTRKRMPSTWEVRAMGFPCTWYLKYSDNFLLAVQCFSGAGL